MKGRPEKDGELALLLARQPLVRRASMKGRPEKDGETDTLATGWDWIQQPR